MLFCAWPQKSMGLGQAPVIKRNVYVLFIPLGRYWQEKYAVVTFSGSEKHINTFHDDEQTLRILL